MMFRNDVTILGNVLGAKKLKNELTRVKIEVPYIKRDGERDSHTISVDFVGSQAEEVEGLEAGSTIFVKALMLKRPAKPDNSDKTYHILTLQADDYKGYRVVPGKVDEGFTEVVFSGRVMRTPELKTGDNGPYCYLSLVYNRPGSKRDDEKGTFIDVGVYGASAEKYVSKYLKEGDCALVQGYLVPRKERFEIKGKNPWGLAFNASAFAGVQAVTPAPRGGGGGKGVAKADTSVYEDDDDIPF